MNSFWMGSIVGSFVLLIAITLVAGHRRRTDLRERLLGQISHRHGWHRGSRKSLVL
jgi:hypothetical protein